MSVLRAGNQERAVVPALAVAMPQHRQPCQICRAPIRHTKRGPLRRPLLHWRYGFSAVMMVVMPANVPARIAMADPPRLQLDIRNACRHVQSGLALHAAGLEPLSI